MICPRGASADIKRTWKMRAGSLHPEFYDDLYAHSACLMPRRTAVMASCMFAGSYSPKLFSPTSPST